MPRTIFKPGQMVTVEFDDDPECPAMVIDHSFPFSEVHVLIKADKNCKRTRFHVSAKCVSDLGSNVFDAIDSILDDMYAADFAGGGTTIGCR